MSSEEDHNETKHDDLYPSQNSKRRKIQRACDMCRRRKTRCDGIQTPNNPCTNCSTYGHECTYVEAAKRRGPPKSYIVSLENKVEKLRQLLSKISPEALDNLERSMDTPENMYSPLPLLSSQPSDIAPSFTPHASSIPLTGNNTLYKDNSESTFLADDIDSLSLDSGDGDGRFFGKSSTAMLIKTALKLKRDYMGEEDTIVTESPPLDPLPSDQDDCPQYSFPEEDLMESLIDLYFTHMNLYLPLLHRPTFERSVAEGLHHSNEVFAATLLLLCAVASRFSDDPRVLLDGTSSLHASGWKWFCQVPMIKKSPLKPPSLYELHFYALLGQFLQASSVPQACWTVVGIGIRTAQEVGAHRHKCRGPNPEDELWKRAFWVLVCMDRLFSSSLGRPCAIHDEDFDIDLPIECDDEYWEHPNPLQRFKQPPTKPSVIIYFNFCIKLNRILALLLRTIYAINRSKSPMGSGGQDWEENLVSKLDSALNKWIDSLPDHLRWDPNREDKIFFNQSASLHAAYYHTQILVHRPFIPSSRKPSAPSLSSIAICTNAARSCSHLLDIQGRRYPVAPPPLQTSAFSAGVILLHSIWGGKRSGLSTDTQKEMADVEKCMNVLKASESRWFLAGRLRDILGELASAGNFSLPQSPFLTHKREREEQEPVATFNHLSDAIESPVPNTISGNTEEHGHWAWDAASSTTTGNTAAPSSGYYRSRFPSQPHQRLSRIQHPPRQQQQDLHSSLQTFSPGGYNNAPFHIQREYINREPAPPQNAHAHYWYEPPPTVGNKVRESSTNQITQLPQHVPTTSSGYGHISTNDTNSTMQSYLYNYHSAGGFYSHLPPTVSIPATPIYQDRQVGTSVTAAALHDYTTSTRRQQISDDTIWANTPTSFGLNEWENYLSDISDPTQDHRSGM